ncbi:MAG TPA: DNA-processing protein DprA [Solirubrobacteraceae bacterium]|nr:DNA-processing protein DprA [Solirubrobacteraceae bacterium]
MTERACDACVARSWLVARLAGHLELARGRIEQVLALGVYELIAAIGGRETARLGREFEMLDVDEVRSRALDAGLKAVCGCDPAYPPGLRALAAPPAVLYVVGGVVDLLAGDSVAIVGSRRATPYGLDMARSLGRDLAVAGLTVVSGMALGIDSAAHAGALEAGGPTIAVLPGQADRPYPPGKRGLYRRIVGEGGAAVSELGQGRSVWRWMFPARNRIIAALAAMTVVVEAGERSGSLVTARLASGVGRPVGAVPGRVTTPQAKGSNGLLAAGACVVRGPQDVLDHLFGVGERTFREPRREPPRELQPLLTAIAEGRETKAALARAGFEPDEGLAALAALELEGFVRRGPGGRYRVAP